MPGASVRHMSDDLVLDGIGHALLPDVDPIDIDPRCAAATSDVKTPCHLRRACVTVSLQEGGLALPLPSG